MSQWFAVVVNWYIDRVRVVAKRLSYYMLVLLEDIAEAMVTFIEQNLCLVRNKKYKKFYHFGFIRNYGQSLTVFIMLSWYTWWCLLPDAVPFQGQLMAPYNVFLEWCFKCTEWGTLCEDVNNAMWTEHSVVKRDTFLQFIEKKPYFLLTKNYSHHKTGQSASDHQLLTGVFSFNFVWKMGLIWQT